MNPAIIRRCFLTGLVLATVLIVLYGCGTVHGYQWVYDDTMPRCEAMKWLQVSADRMQRMCWANGSLAASNTLACATGCVVFSTYTEDQARGIDLWGESLRDHEARHIFNRMKHPS